MLFIWTIACVLAVSTHTTAAASLVCYKESVKDSKALPLAQSTGFVNTKYIPNGCELIVVIHGYSTEINEDIIRIIETLITKFGDTKCYCALNWKKESAAYIGTVTDPVKNVAGVNAILLDYPIVSATAGLVVANELTDALIAMKSRGLNIDALHIIGHSEGAHLGGKVGKNLRDSGCLIARITALDPAKPPVQEPLKKGFAKLVDCIHTDPNFLGTKEAVCDIDFWVNYGCKVQPDCEENTTLFTPESLCSHVRAFLYKAEAIKDPNSFQGRKAANYKEFLNSDAAPSPDEVNFIGFDIIPSITGSFYLCTNAAPEFGKGHHGMDPSSCTC